MSIKRKRDATPLEIMGELEELDKWELSEDGKELDRLNFLLLVGDWCDVIDKAVKFYEGPRVEPNLPGDNITTIDAKACHEYHIKVEGKKLGVADGFAAPSGYWSAAREHWCSTVVANVDLEVQKVKDWRGSWNSISTTPMQFTGNRL